MRVLCIKDSEEIAYTRKGPQRTPDNMRIFFGETYTVVEEVVGYKGEKKWVLAERPKNCRYRKLHFALPSNIDEMEVSVEFSGTEQVAMGVLI